MAETEQSGASGAPDARSYAEPRACAVCQNVTPVMVLADLEVAEVCEFCKPLVLEIVKVRRQGAGLGDDAVKRAVEVAKELNEVCSEVARAEPPAQ